MSTDTGAKGTFRWWLITVNNPKDDWFSFIEALSPDYAIAQLEQGDLGTKHIQGCMYFKKGKRSSFWKSMPAWVKGISAKDALEKVCKYCSKAETRIDGPREIGTRPSSSTRNFAQAKTMCEVGRVKEIDPDILIPYYGNLKKIAADMVLPYTHTDVRGLWVCGPPGVGKTHFLRERYPSAYIKSQNKWWDAYAGQESVILDDFDLGGRVLGHHVKIWADKWACYGEIKGATVALRYKVFAITSNYVPDQIWSDDPVMVEAIRRRFKFIEFISFGKYVDL